MAHGSHTLSRGGLSATGIVGFARFHRWPKRRKAGGASAGESEELSGVCGLRAGEQAVVERTATVSGSRGCRRTHW
jgi:hypothetical protein